jgi:hypothetical protein
VRDPGDIRVMIDVLPEGIIKVLFVAFQTVVNK